ncbi:hypothetical protein CARUB_v10021358mg [Capsella rubella]|uniref:X8 domain-containing protein n=1 Tax=Capsella rubella TaxID=81985 RepID=R0GDK0_9BRAS|nr:glucan endo-1,3-beta-glucosidase [Capsella rubella]EOA33867.1 hypothetical protein CARUB_v10021358mg [Capsella rubella]
MFPRLTLIFFISFFVIHSLHVSAKTWCVSDPSASEAQLQVNLDWLCGNLDCGIVKSGGSCYEPNTVASHASYMMNVYYQLNGATKEACYFTLSGRIIESNPSYGGCVYI